MSDLRQLIAEAEVLAGGEHPCEVLGHKWESQGGRACRRDPHYGSGDCSQTVFQCTVCEVYDYGDPGGPGDEDCLHHCMRRAA